MRRVSWPPRLIVASLVTAAVMCAACGGSGQSISRDGAKLLQSQVAAARTAAAHGDPGRAALLLQAIEKTVGSLRAQHMISDRRAAGVLAALGDTQDALRNWVGTSTTTTISTTTTTTTPPGDGEHRRGKKHGEGGD